MNVNWIKCNNGKWCSLEKVNLTDVKATGVYIIWHGGTRPRVVRVGQGDIAKRLSTHRNDRKITQYAQAGTLYVTWASVPRQNDRNGVERYLADKWNPLVGDAFPDVAPIAVNSPWS